jgi:hypothetical protein
MDKKVVRFGDVKVKMPPKVDQQYDGVKEYYGQDNPRNPPGPLSVFKSQIIHKDKDVKKTGNLERVITGKGDIEKVPDPPSGQGLRQKINKIPRHGDKIKLYNP